MQNACRSFPLDPVISELGRSYADHNRTLSGNEMAADRA
jgi:hypothetical protein